MCSGTPRSWAIRRDLADVVHRQRPAAGVGVRVLEDDEAGDRLVEVVRVAEGVVDLARVHRPVGALAEGADRGPDDDGVAAGLVHDGVGRLAGDGLVAAGQVGHERRRGCPSCRSRRTGPPPCRGARAARASSSLTVGSSPKTSSPTRASAIARRMAAVGWVTVSERRSMTGGMAAASIARVVRAGAREGGPGRAGSPLQACLHAAGDGGRRVSGAPWQVCPLPARQCLRSEGRHGPAELTGRRTVRRWGKVGGARRPAAGATPPRARRC